MSFIEILIIGFALSLDAFATMMANSSAYQSKSKGFNLFAVFTIAFLHAFFCVVGYLCAFYTVFLSEEICSYFVACIFLLMSVSALYSAIKKEEKLERQEKIPIKAFLLQSAVTSIDAFCGGLAFGAMGSELYLIAVVLFCATAIMTYIGLLLGRLLKKGLNGGEKYVFSIIFFILFLRAL
ncbi:MAG: manganese efflux pump [Clostridia bacterium]|nr:manganese efflux pump [Clostridia bacterium]